MKRQLAGFFLFGLGLLLISGCNSEDVAPAKKSPQPQAEKVTDHVSSEDPAEKAPRDDESQRQGPADEDNSPPLLKSVKIQPFPAYPGDNLSVVVETEDRDGDLVVLDYEWRKNNEALSGETMSELDTSGMSKGDMVTVVVTPGDGQVKGEAMESSPVLLHNRPPEITSYPPAGLEDGEFSYQVMADDPDGDTLEYALEDAPSGMTIDKETGLLQWSVTPDQAGRFDIRITVSDGDAKAYQSFDMQVGAEQ